MTTQNYPANSRYIAAYQHEIASGLRNARHAKGLISALRDRAERSLIRSRVWPWSSNGLEADTRQIRSFDRSASSGACEVVQGLRLAT